jgi:uncharacterized protein YjbI with pentapeptide repeats
VDDQAVVELLGSNTLSILNLADCNLVKFHFTTVQNFDMESCSNSQLKSLCLRHTKVDDLSVRNITRIFSDLRIIDLRHVYFPSLRVSFFQFWFSLLSANLQLVCVLEGELSGIHFQSRLR